MYTFTTKSLYLLKIKVKTKTHLIKIKLYYYSSSSSSLLSALSARSLFFTSKSGGNTLI